jgi:hypothetical protein
MIKQQSYYSSYLENMPRQWGAPGAHVYSGKVGDAVDARFNGKSRWFPGRVSAVNENGTYGIEYDDGDTESALESENIRAVGTTCGCNSCMGLLPRVAGLKTEKLPGAGAGAGTEVGVGGAGAGAGAGAGVGAGAGAGAGAEVGECAVNTSDDDDDAVGSGTNTKRDRLIEQLDLETGDVVQVFASVRSANEALGQEPFATNIHHPLKHPGGRAYGFGWRYAASTCHSSVNSTAKPAIYPPPNVCSALDRSGPKIILKPADTTNETKSNRTFDTITAAALFLKVKRHQVYASMRSGAPLNCWIIANLEQETTTAGTKASDTEGRTRGTRVNVLWEGSLYAATISRVHRYGSFDVKFDTGGTMGYDVTATEHGLTIINEAHPDQPATAHSVGSKSFDEMRLAAPADVEAVIVAGVTEICVLGLQQEASDSPPIAVEMDTEPKRLARINAPLPWHGARVEELGATVARTELHASTNHKLTTPSAATAMADAVAAAAQAAQAGAEADVAVAAAEAAVAAHAQLMINAPLCPPSEGGSTGLMIEPTKCTIAADSQPMDGYPDSVMRFLQRIPSRSASASAGATGATAAASDEAGTELDAPPQYGPLKKCDAYRCGEKEEALIEEAIRRSLEEESTSGGGAEATPTLIQVATNLTPSTDPDITIIKVHSPTPIEGTAARPIVL